MKLFYNDYRLNNLIYKVNPQADKLYLESNQKLVESGQTSLNKMHLSISKSDQKIILSTHVQVDTKLNDAKQSNYRSVSFDLVMSFLISQDDTNSEDEIFQTSHELVMAVMASKLKEIVRQISLLDYLPPITIRSFGFPDEFGFNADNVAQNQNKSE